jgi:hypothetical protein
MAFGKYVDWKGRFNLCSILCKSDLLTRYSDVELLLMWRFVNGSGATVCFSLTWLRDHLRDGFDAVWWTIRLLAINLRSVLYQDSCFPPSDLCVRW